MHEKYVSKTSVYSIQHNLSQFIIWTIYAYFSKEDNNPLIFYQWEQQRGKWEEKSSYQLNSRSITALKSCDFTHPSSCLTYVKKKVTPNYWQKYQPNHLLLHCCSYTDWLHQYHECENKLFLENYLLYKLRQILYLLYRWSK